MKKSHHKVIIISTIIVVCLFSFCFALAPLYNALCKATGFHGRLDLTARTAIQNQQIPDVSRQLTMQFVATNNANLPWDFYPKKNTLFIYPEVNNQMIFTIHNKTNKTMTVQAIPSITPWQAAKHLHKIECFCFRQQTLKAGESLDMPVIFRIDKDLPANVKTITLAYTLFDITNQKRKVR
jgi:cytochrome c oxidase assembly protein subunit 11